MSDRKIKGLMKKHHEIDWKAAHERASQGEGQAMREMTLAEWVDRLPPRHRAREEYEELLDAEARVDVAHAADKHLLRALLREIALSGVEYEGSDLMRVQIDRETWDEIQRVAGREEE